MTAGRFPVTRLRRLRRSPALRALVRETECDRFSDSGVSAGHHRDFTGQARACVRHRFRSHQTNAIAEAKAAAARSPAIPWAAARAEAACASGM